jgi:CubicO group peptidase (beta-lactamase class C family)
MALRQPSENQGPQMMMRRFAIVLALIAYGITAACVNGPKAEKTYDFTGVTSYLETGYKSLGLPGASLLVWHEGRVVYEHYFGSYAPDTQVAIASSSKWLSAATVMTLVDDGSIDLDAKVSRYLPGFTGEKADMTIRQMFSHSSGLVDFPGQWDYATTPLAYAEKVAREGIMVARPGTEVRYASASMQVVGAIAEKVSGKRWNDFFMERIAQPCGMTNTTYARQPTNTNPLLAGGAFSTLQDYSRFLQMIANKGVCNGQRVLSEKAVAEMQKDQTKDLPLKQASNDRMGRASHYGLGQWIDVSSSDGQTIQVSSPGAFGFRPWLNLDRNLYAVFMMRRADQQAPYAGNAFDPWKLIDLVHATVDAAE